MQAVLQLHLTPAYTEAVSGGASHNALMTMLEFEATRMHITAEAAAVVQGLARRGAPRAALVRLIVSGVEASSQFSLSLLEAGVLPAYAGGMLQTCSASAAEAEYSGLAVMMQRREAYAAAALDAGVLPLLVPFIAAPSWAPGGTPCVAFPGALAALHAMVIAHDGFCDSHTLQQRRRAAVAAGARQALAARLESGLHDHAAKVTQVLAALEGTK